MITDWPEAAARDKFADCVIIATPDRKHKVSTIATSPIRKDKDTFFCLVIAIGHREGVFGL